MGTHDPKLDELLLLRHGCRVIYEPMGILMDKSPYLLGLWVRVQLRFTRTHKAMDMYIPNMQEKTIIKNNGPQHVVT